MDDLGNVIPCLCEFEEEVVCNFPRFAIGVLEGKEDLSHNVRYDVTVLFVVCTV